MNKRFRKAMKPQKPFYDCAIEHGLGERIFGVSEIEKTKLKRALSKKLCKETLSLLHKTILLEIGRKAEIEYDKIEQPYYLLLKMPDDIKPYLLWILVR